MLLNNLHIYPRLRGSFFTPLEHYYFYFENL